MTQVLVAENSTRGPHLNPTLFQTGFTEDKLVLEHIFLSVLQLCPPIIIPPVLHTHSSREFSL